MVKARASSLVTNYRMMPRINTLLRLSLLLCVLYSPSVSAEEKVVHIISAASTQAEATSNAISEALSIYVGTMVEKKKLLVNGKYYSVTELRKNGSVSIVGKKIHEYRENYFKATFSIKINDRLFLPYADQQRGYNFDIEKLRININGYKDQKQLQRMQYKDVDRYLASILGLIAEAIEKPINKQEFNVQVQSLDIVSAKQVHSRQSPDVDYVELVVDVTLLQDIEFCRRWNDVRAQIGRIPGWKNQWSSGGVAWVDTPKIIRRFIYLSTNFQFQFVNSTGIVIAEACNGKDCILYRNRNNHFTSTEDKNFEDAALKLLACHTPSMLDDSDEARIGAPKAYKVRLKQLMPKWMAEKTDQIRVRPVFFSTQGKIRQKILKKKKHEYIGYLTKLSSLKEDVFESRW